MRRLVALAAVVLAAALGWPARAEVLIGLAGPMTGKSAWGRRAVAARRGPGLKRPKPDVMGEHPMRPGLLDSGDRLVDPSTACSG